VAKAVIPRPKITESLIQLQTDHSTSQITTGTPLGIPQSLFKPSTVKLVPPPNSLSAATVPIPTTSGPTALSSSQNFNIFNMASNLEIDKFKGDNMQNVDTWLSMYKQYCSCYDLSDKYKAQTHFLFI
jgi:hypothetical protein